MWSSTLVMLQLALVTLPGYSAGIYRWVDTEGRVHFGDDPPPEGAERVEVNGSKSPDPGLAERRRRGARISEILEEDRVGRDEARAAEIQARKDRQARCDRARQNLERAERSAYIYRESGDPRNPDILDEAERQQYEGSLLEEVRNLCGTENALP